MSTESYDKYISKLRFIIENECDGSRMSNTKWQELFSSAFSIRQQISFNCRVKVLDDDAACHWAGFVSYTKHQGADGTETIWIEPSGGPVPSIAIEWIEIKPTGLDSGGSAKQKIERWLDTLHVPYTVKDDIIRITGHVRRSTPPIITRSR